MDHSTSSHWISRHLKKIHALHGMYLSIIAWIFRRFTRGLWSGRLHSTNRPRRLITYIHRDIKSKGHTTQRSDHPQSGVSSSPHIGQASSLLLVASRHQHNDCLERFFNCALLVEKVAQCTQLIHIQQSTELLRNVSWHHIASASNPADLLSRGLPASELIPLKLWWEGPPWLRLPPHQWPKPQFTVPQVLPEIKTVILIAPPTQQRRLWDDISNFDHLVRIATWIRRFYSNSRLSSEKRNLQSIITTQEYDSTKQHLILQSQKETFPEAFKAIEKKASLPKGHSLSSFTLTQARDGTLLIATRVRDPREVNNQKTLTPMSLNSTLTRNLLHTLHLRHLHPGVNTMLAIVGSSFHIPGVKNFIKGISRKCPKCQRAYERGSIQSMDLLPSVHTTPATPFSHSGLDFPGPFLTKRGYTRRPVIIKTYACLFTYLST